RDETARAADEETFLAGQTPRHRERISIIDRSPLVDHRHVESTRNLVLADSLYLVGGRLALVARLRDLPEDRTDRISPDDADVRVPLLQIAADARNRPARAGRGDEMGDPPLRLFPDLGPCGRVMGGRIGGIVELVGEDRV